MKFIGSLIIILSLTFIGRLYSNKISQRVKYIKMIIELLEYIRNEILYNMTSILELVNKLNNNAYLKKLDIFDKLCNNLSNSKSISDSWRLAIKDSKITYILTKEDVNEINKIGDWLGDSSIEGQISNINLTSQLLKQKLDQAQSDKEKYYKIYNSFGILSGVALVILIW